MAVMENPQPPNPGSAEAKDMGCLCPVLDNNHGAYPPWADGGWWVNEGCPLHDRTAIEDS
jgi:hypothetical protein